MAKAVDRQGADRPQTDHLVRPWDIGLAPTRRTLPAARGSDTPCGQGTRPEGQVRAENVTRSRLATDVQFSTMTRTPSGRTAARGRRHPLGRTPAHRCSHRPHAAMHDLACRLCPTLRPTTGILRKYMAGAASEACKAKLRARRGVSPWRPPLGPRLRPGPEMPRLAGCQNPPEHRPPSGPNSVVGGTR